MISATSDHGVVTVKLVRGPDLVLNPESGLDLTGTRVAFVQTERDGSTTASPFMTPDQAKAQGHSFTMTHETNQFSHLLWEFRFRTRHATLHADPEIVVMKKITPLTAPIAGWDPGALFGHPYGPAPTLPGLNEYQPSSASGSAASSR